MHRFFLLFTLLLVSALSWSGATFAQSTDGLPARPSPFRFVTDEAKLLTEANVKTLENGLRSYADETGTQIVVVTVPTLGGRSVSDFGSALGEAWNIGQRDKNNGVVLLLSGQERKVTIQAGSGLQNVITPELTARVINQQMTPSFKQGNYFMGLRKGLNTLMLAANPNSDPRKDQAATASSATPLPSTSPDAGSPELGSTPPAQSYDPATEPFKPQSSVPAPESSGLGLGTLAIGALLIGGVIWLLVRVFRRRNSTVAPPTSANTPDFMGNRPTGPTGPVNRGGPQQSAPDFYGNNRMGGNMGNNTGGGIGSGMGGILATGAAAAAGAYLGNRMASGGHDENNYSGGHNAAGFGGQPSAPDAGAAGLAGGAGLAGAAGGSSDFPALGNTEETAPDYFSDDVAGNSEPDYFSSGDSSSYDDLSSDDTGGGGFDSDDDNSGSW
jgi:uncharacterized protein